MVPFRQEVVQEQADSTQLIRKIDFTRSGSGGAAKLKKRLLTYENGINNNKSATSSTFVAEGRKHKTCKEATVAGEITYSKFFELSLAWEI